MDQNTLSLVVVIILILLLLTVPAWRTRRTIYRIIFKFRDAKAIDPASAKLPDELGLNTNIQPSSIFTGSDPVQSALSKLRDNNIILRTPEGKLYLSEDNLAKSKWSTDKR